MIASPPVRRAKPERFIVLGFPSYDLAREVWGFNSEEDNT